MTALSRLNSSFKFHCYKLLWAMVKKKYRYMEMNCKQREHWWMNAGSPKQQISLLELNRSFQLHPMVIDAKWKKFKFDYCRSLIHRSLQSTIFMFFELCSTQTQYTMGTLSSQLIVFSRYRFALWSAKYIQSRKQALWMLTGIEKFTNISNWLCSQ